MAALPSSHLHRVRPTDFLLFHIHFTPSPILPSPTFLSNSALVQSHTIANNQNQFSIKPASKSDSPTAKFTNQSTKMGACLSSEPTDRKLPCAYIVTANGQLCQLSVPITVSEVLQSENSSPDSFFLCNSDRLYFDDFIPSLELQEELRPAQIYFVLPKSKLQYRLAASDMAALAVKASIALEQINRRRRSKSKARISPIFAVEETSQSDQERNQTTISSVGNIYHTRSKSSSTGIRVSKSGSVRKLARYSSRRAKLAIRSFRIRLGTISEGSAL